MPAREIGSSQPTARAAAGFAGDGAGEFDVRVFHGGHAARVVRATAARAAAARATRAIAG